ncbi:MAG: hypothetical protein ACI9WU_005477, partial [Myxococcota bacterium]
AASDKALLQRAREVVRSRPTSRRGRRSMVLQVAGERLREQLLQLNPGRGTREWAQWIGRFLGPLTEMSLQVTSGRRGTEVIDARLRLRADGDAADLSRVQGALSKTFTTNRVNLPRAVTAEDLRQGLRYRVRVDDARVVARRLLDTQWRSLVTVVDDTHLTIDVRPAPEASAAVVAQPLSAGERRRLLSSDSDVRWNSGPIKRLARELAPDGTPAQRAAAILKWVVENVRYEIDPGYREPLEVLRVRKGDCTEFSQLTAALFRASGVPAVLRDGFSASGKGMVAHAWVAYHDGVGWREVEPTSGSLTVGSGHVEMSVSEVLALLELNAMEVEAVDRLPENP